MSAAPERAEDTGWYLYGVVASAAPLRLDSEAVDPGHRVVAIAEDALAGVASRISLQEFGEAALAERLGDASWLEQKIRAHEQVLEGVLAAAPIVPCRFCTVYRTENELRRFLTERSAALSEALARFAERVELGVKAFVDVGRFAAGEDSVRELRDRAAHAEGGRAYLEARRLQQRVGEELVRFKGEVAGELHARLLAAAEDGLALGLQRPEVSGRDGEMAFNGAYLVGDRADFERELSGLARELGPKGVELELTGPWPPYNFVPAELGAS